MNCHKVPLTFGDDKKQTDKTDYPDAFFVADFIYFFGIYHMPAHHHSLQVRSPLKIEIKTNKYIYSTEETNHENSIFRFQNNW